MPLVATERDGPVTYVRMQDPARRNALSSVMLDELIRAFDQLSADTRAVILRAGPEDRVWCAGFDIGALAPGLDPLAPDGALHALFNRLHDCPAPVIAMLHGSAWGGGTDLALRCDIRIGDPTSSFAFTPARLGLPYDLPGLLNATLRAGPALAAEMFATANPVGAQRAAETGLLNHLVAEAELEAFTLQLARRIAENAPLSVRSAIRHIRSIGLALSAGTQRDLQAGRQDALASEDYAEGLQAFGAKRAAVFRGR